MELELTNCAEFDAIQSVPHNPPLPCLTMKRLIPALLFALSPLALHATEILSDNFNAPDTTNFDGSDQSLRRSGLLGPSVQLRSSLIQHAISGYQLRLLRAASEGRIRFHDAANLANWWDFASGEAGETILAEGGFKLEFDWTPINATDANWIEVSVGIGNQTVAEPATRVNHAQTDLGILLRNSGGSQIFDNGSAVIGGTVPVTAAKRRVSISYAFNSFANATTVTANAFIDGAAVITNRNFTWDNNNNQLFIEFGTNVPTTNGLNTLIDNFTIKGLRPRFSPAISSTRFFSSVSSSGLVATLSGTTDGTPEEGTFTLVPGNGDTDNALFKINGARLEPSGALDFLNVPDNSTYSIRIRGTGTTSATFSERSYSLTLISDTDSDNLGDTWESAKAGNLTDLTALSNGPGPGPGSGNFDADSLSDAQEYALAISRFPNLNPRAADSDGDGLEDGAELSPTPPRPETNPTLADSDGDGLNDLTESNTGTFVSASDTGSNPARYDSDGDQYPDGFEARNAGNPLDPNILPTALPPGFALGIVTDDASTGISPDFTYTHKISGGSPATINGVDLDVLDAVSTPPNFAWDGFTGGKNFIGPAINNGEWISSVTEPGAQQLFGTFTFSGAGSTPGNRQRFTLSGLEPGLTYEFRLYVRKWSNITVRPAALTFINGSESREFFLLEDRPSIVLNDATKGEAAYFLSCTYTAQSTDFIMDVLVPPVSSANGSFHMYGLTNRAAGAPPDLEIASISRAPDGSKVTLTIKSRPSRIYAVDFSTNLASWIELSDAVPSAGNLTTYEDSVASNRTNAFYRIRDVTPP
jgi:hypothetical protein